MKTNTHVILNSLLCYKERYWDECWHLSEVCGLDGSSISWLLFWSWWLFSGYCGECPCFQENTKDIKNFKNYKYRKEYTKIFRIGNQDANLFSYDSGKFIIWSSCNFSIIFYCFKVWKYICNSIVSIYFIIKANIYQIFL